MQIESLQIPGSALIRPTLHEDHRGAFARTYCRKEYAAAALDADLVQASMSFNEKRGTLRGLHFQWPPSREAKTVRCTRGALFDVLVDLRPNSPTYLLHISVELEASGQLAIFIPPGVAHGFQTLMDATEVLYLMSDYFEPDSAGVVRWDDASFGIAWPLPAPTLSKRDAECPEFNAARHEEELLSRSAGAGWTAA